MSTLYIDANVLIYLLEGHPNLGYRAADVLMHHQRADIPMVTSTVTLAEFLAGHGGDASALRQIDGLSFIDLTPAIAEQAGQLRYSTKLKLGDAIHFATALQAGADKLFTNDRSFAKIAAQYLTVITL